MLSVALSKCSPTPLPSKLPKTAAVYCMATYGKIERRIFAPAADVGY